MREQAEAVAADLENGKTGPAEDRALMETTRYDVARGWAAIAKQLLAHGDQKLAAHVVDFVKGMPPPTTDREFIARAVLDSAKLRQRIAQGPSR